MVVEGASRGAAMVVDVAADGVRLRYEAMETPARPRITLVLAMPRPKAMRGLWRHLPGLGVAHVAVVKAASTPASYFGTHWLEERGYLSLLREGLEQAGTPWMPEVEVTRGFGHVVRRVGRAGSSGRLFAAHPGAGRTLVDATVASVGRAPVLALGPEGGWRAAELDLLNSFGFEQVSLTQAPLRSDAACVAGLAILCMRCEAG